MTKTNFQKGSIEVSAIAGITIIAAIIVVTSTIAVIKYRETSNMVAPLITVSPSPTEQPITEKIISSEVTVSDCKIKINTTKGEILLTTEYSQFYPEKKCYQFLLNKVSPSGKYVAFQDISGGLDSALRIYSLEYNENIQLDVLGTSSIFDISFLPDDKLISLSGYKGIYNEQSLSVYDIPGLFTKYPSNIDKQYKYFTSLNIYNKIIALPNIGKDYSSLAVSGSVLKIYGTGGVNAGILKEYNFDELIIDPINPTATPTPDATTDWQTYNNAKYQFTMKYPNTWTAIENTSLKSPYLANITFGLTKTIQEGGSFGLTLRDQTEEEYLASLKKEGYVILNNVDTTLGGKKAIFYTFNRKDSPKSQWKEIVAKDNNFLITFSSGANTNQESIFNQMLSTFKFTK
jgi:hypothetical protein